MVKYDGYGNPIYGNVKGYQTPNLYSEKELADSHRTIQFLKETQLQNTDPRRAQLLALYDLSDDRGKELLLSIAGIHAACYPKENKHA